MASIGKIAVQITARTRRFRRSLSRISTRLIAFGARVGSVAKILALFTVGLGVAIAAAAVIAIRKVEEYGDTLGKMAKRTGLTAQELARFKFAAELSGATLEDVEKAILKTQKSIFDLERGLTETKFAFDELGISLEDIKSLNPSEQFDLLISRLAEMDNIQRRNAIGIQLLGRGFKNLAPLLDDGAEGIAKLKSEADRLGLVLDPRQIRAAEEYRDALARVKGALFGIVLQNTNLEKLAFTFNTLANIAVDFGNSFSKGLDSATDSTDLSESAFDRLIITVGGFLTAASRDLPAIGKLFTSVFFVAIGEVGERLEFFIFKEFPNGLKQFVKLIGVFLAGVIGAVIVALRIIGRLALDNFQTISKSLTLLFEGKPIEATKLFAKGLRENLVKESKFGAELFAKNFENVLNAADKILRPLVFVRSEDQQRQVDQLKDQFNVLVAAADKAGQDIADKLFQDKLAKVFIPLEDIEVKGSQIEKAAQTLKEALRPAAIERGTQAAFSAELDPVTSAVQKVGKEQLNEQQITNRLLRDIKDEAESTNIVSIPI